MSKERSILSKNEKSPRAFSINELVIIVAIIATLILASVAIYRNSQARTRDTERIAELNNLRAALHLYRIKNLHYPPNDLEWCSIEALSPDSDYVYCHSAREAIAPYFNQIPGDPLFPEREGDKFYSYQYQTIDFGMDYKIHAELEKGGSYEIYSLKGFAIEYAHRISED